MIRHHARVVAVLIGSLFCLAGQAGADTIRVTTTAQHAAPGEGCTISDAITSIGLIASVYPNQPFGDCVLENDADPGITIRVPAGTYVLTTPAVDIEDAGAAGLPIIGPMSLPFLGVPWGVHIEGDPAGGTIITRDPAAPPFRLFWVKTWLDIRHLTLEGAEAGFNCCGAHYKGGAIYGDDLLPAEIPVAIDIQDVTFLNNRAGMGGAISDLNSYYGKGVAVTVENSVFRGNHADSGGAIEVAPTGVLIVRGSLFEDNVVSGGGGAIDATYGDRQIAIADSEFRRNHADGANGGAISAPNIRLTRVNLHENTSRDGGGAVHSDGGPVAIIDSTFAANRSRRGGGLSAVSQGNPVQISGSTFVGNEATQNDGGGIFLDDRTGLARITNSTFSSNVAVVDGTAISVSSGGLTLINDTITGNRTSTSWGPALRGYWDAPTLRLSNTIVAGNTTGGNPLDIYVDQGRAGALISLGSNLIGNSDGTNDVFVQPGDRVGSPATPLDPGLLPLADNGGPTLTHALAPGSFALDAGSLLPPGTDEACEPLDQRGAARPGAGTLACDIGAFEAAAAVADTTPPVLTLLGANPQSIERGQPYVELGADASDGIDTTVNAASVVIDASAVNTGVAGTYAVTYGVSDASGNTATATRSVIVSEPAPTGGNTRTLVTSSSNPSGAGEAITLTAVVTVVAPGMGTPAGSVIFLETTTITTLGTVTLDAEGHAVIEGVRLPSGLRTIQAIYAAAGLFHASAGTLAQTVNRAPSMTTLTATPSSSVVGQLVELSAHVAATPPFGGSPSGTVRFVDATTGGVLGVGDIDSSGTAILAAALTSAGTHTITAVYLESAAFASSEGSATQPVGSAATTTTLTSSANPSVRNQGIAFTAVVAAAAPGGGTPAGTMTFEDVTAGTTLMTTGLVDGRAVMAIGNLAYGTHLIRASFAGDANFTGSSARVSQVVTVPRFDLTVAWNAGGEILTTGVPLPCASPCSISYEGGTTAMLTARPAAGTVFLGWTGACVGVATCVLTMDEARSVGARFVVGVPLSVIAQHTRNPEGIPCPYGSGCTAVYPAGTRVTVTALPLNYAIFSTPFIRWVAPTPCAPSANPVCTVVMNDAVALTAKYRSATDRAPTAEITRAIPGFGPVNATGPLTSVALSGASSSDPDGGALTYRWTVENQTGTGVFFTPLLSPGNHLVGLEVTATDGDTAAATLTVAVADNAPPVITFPVDLVLEATDGLHATLPLNAVTAVDAVYGSVNVVCGYRDGTGHAVADPDLELGRNIVFCEAWDYAVNPYTNRPNRATGSFVVTVVASLARFRVEALLGAVDQTIGATKAMDNAAKKLLNALEKGRSARICPDLAAFVETVRDAVQRKKIDAADGQALIAAAQEIAGMAGCG